MSVIKIKGSSANTGDFTIQPPDSATDRTITLPDVANGTILSTESTVPPKVPMFMVELSDSNVQQVTLNTWTVVVFDTEEIDTHGWYNTSNGRFTPQTAGYYQMNVQVQPHNAYATQGLAIYKNGVPEKMGSWNLNQDMGSAHLNAVVYANGTTDYFEAYWTSGVTQYINGSDSSPGSAKGFTYFQGYLIRTG